jgi:hypothetical protein
LTAVGGRARRDWRQRQQTAGCGLCAVCTRPAMTNKKQAGGGGGGDHPHPHPGGSSQLHSPAVQPEGVGVACRLSRESDGSRPRGGRWRWRV